MSDNRIWTVAVAGCGIGRAHIEGYKSHPDKFRVVALCDVDEGRLAVVGSEFSIARRTRSFDELLCMDDVHIVDICTPPALHVAQILAALAAGKEVVCEKPLAGSLAEELGAQLNFFATYTKRERLPSRAARAATARNSC